MPKKNIMREFSIGEISAVDKPAQKGARMAIMKRDNGELSTAIAKYYYNDSDKATSFVDALKITENNKKLWELREELSPLIEAISRSINSTLADKELTMEAKRARIEQSADDFVAELRNKMPDLEDDLAKAFTAEALGKTETAIEETNMADETKAEDVIKALKADLAKAETLAKMSDAEKAYADKLDDKAKADFMSADDDTRKKMMASAKKNDVTVEVEGKTISKSEVGEDAFKAFEKMAEFEARLAKAEGEATLSKFEKRAADELANVIGTPVAKAHALMAVDAIQDTVAKDALTAILKAANEANASDMVTKGVSGDVGEGNAMDAIEKKADEIAKRDGIAKDAAIAKAWAENPELYAQYNGGDA